MRLICCGANILGRSAAVRARKRLSARSRLAAKRADSNKPVRRLFRATFPPNRCDEKDGIEVALPAQGTRARGLACGSVSACHPH